MTVSNVVGPMMLYMDRFVIGALVSATAVAYYATPFEVITKLFIVTGAISAVMFPAFSSAGAADPGRSLKLYWRGMASIVVLILPLGILLIVGAKEALALWLGADFAGHSYRVAQLLLIGTSVMAMEALPFVFIQGLGRPDIPAKLNLLELPFYAVALYWLVMAHGVTGAAIAWMLRGIADTALLIYFAHKLQKSPAKEDSAVDMVSAASVEL